MDGVDIAGATWDINFARMEGLPAPGGDAERMAEYETFWWGWVVSGVDLDL